MTTLLPSDRDHAIDRLARGDNGHLEVVVIEQFVPYLMPLSEAFRLAVHAEVSWPDGHLAMRAAGRYLQFPEVTAHD